MSVFSEKNKTVVSAKKAIFETLTASEFSFATSTAPAVGDYLQAEDVNGKVKWVNVAPGGGDVSFSDGTVVDNQVVRFDETTGKIIQGGSNPVTISNSGDLTVTAGDLTVTTGDLTVTKGDIVVSEGDLTVTKGGVTATTGDITATAGDITATAGNISATAGSVTAGADVTAGVGLKATTGGLFLSTYANDAAAALGGVAVGEIYLSSVALGAPTFKVRQL